MFFPVPAPLAGALRPLHLAVATIAVLPLSACRQDLADRIPEPRTVRDVGPTPKQPFVVFVTGDEEYRSEESMPMLAEILERDFGFRTSVCYAVDEKGEVSPNRLDHIQGLEQLADADLVVWFTRFRQLPENEVGMLLDYVERGGPLVGFRTATHPFRYPEDHPLATEFNDRWPARVFGQRWTTHHGHFSDGDQFLTDVTLGEANDHPILRGIEPFKAYSWLYHVEGGGDSISGSPAKLLTGKTLRSNHAKRHERFPATNTVAWTKEHDEGEKNARVFFSTLGHPYDFKQESMRRLALQGILWALGLEAEIPKSGVKADPTFTWDPPNSGFGEKYRKHVFPHAPRRGGPRRIEVKDGETIAYIGFGPHPTGQPDRAVEIEGVLQAAFPERSLRFRTPSGITRPPKGWNEALDRWLRQVRPDTVVIDQAGDSTDPDGIDQARREVRAQVRKVLRTSYDDGQHRPQVILVSPRGLLVQTGKPMTDDSRDFNRRVEGYRDALERVARDLDIAYVDLFTPTVSYDWRPLMDAEGNPNEGLIATQYALWFLGLLGEKPNVIVTDQLLDTIRMKNAALDSWTAASDEESKKALWASVQKGDAAIHQLVR